MPNLPSGTVTFLFTDIEGSTKLWEQQPLAMKGALSRHDDLLHQAIASHGGYVFKTVGDAFCAAFANPADGLAAALDAQRSLLAPISSLQIKARMALHTGTSEERDGDYFGPTLNRVARLLSTGYGGQILLSLATQGLVRNQLPPEVGLRDLGEHPLKDLSHTERIYQVLCPELPGEFPPLKTPDQAAADESTHRTPAPPPPDDSPLHVHLFGVFHIEQAGQVFHASTHKGEALLAYLALRRGQPQTRQQLAFLLWADSPDAQARSNLRTLLHRLRTSLPGIERCLDADSQHVAWRTDAPAMLDVDEFEQALAQADSAERASDPAAAAAARERAATIYQADLLPDCYDDWIAPERERLRGLLLKTLERLAADSTQSGSYANAIAHARRILSIDVLHESAYLALIRLYAASGDRAAALRIYQTCMTVFRAELHTEPGSAIRAAYAQLLQSDPSELPLLPTNAPLVGREAEWQHLQAAWARALNREPKLLLISGEAGTGKTRLAEELSGWVRRQAATVAVAHCYTSEAELAYAPVIAWLREPGLTQRRKQLDPAWLSELSRLLPEVRADRTDVGEPAPLRESWQRQRLFEGLARATLSGDQPLLLCIDDVQWCDRDSLEWLHFLLRFDTKARLLVVATARIDELDDNPALLALLGDLRHADRMDEIGLGSLSRRDTLILAQQLGAVAGDQTAADLYAETEGNPLFIVETVRAAATAGAGAAREGAVTGPAAGQTGKVQALIAQRLAHLTPASQEVLRVAAVIGRSFTFDVLQRAVERDEERVVRSIDELWRRRIIREQGAAAYDFTHERLRAVAYAGLSPARKRLLHRRVAEVLEVIHAQELEPVSLQLAQHYEQAGFGERAAHAYRRAADLSQRIYANAEAIDGYRRALALHTAALQGSATAERRAEVSAVAVQLGDVLHRVGQYDEAAATYAGALQHAEPADVIARADLQRKLGNCWRDLHRYDEAGQAYTAAESILGEPQMFDQQRWQAWSEVQLERLNASYWLARVDEIHRLVAQLQPIVEQYGNTQQRARLHQSLALSGIRESRYVVSGETLAHARAYISALEDSGDATWLPSAYFQLGLFLLCARELAEAEQQMLKALAQAEQRGDVSLEGRCLTYLTVVYRWLNQPEQVQPYAERSLRHATRSGMQEYIGAARGNLAWLAWRRQDMAAVRAQGRLALDAWQQLPIPYIFHWLALWPLLGAALHAGDTPEALAHARAMLDRAQPRLPEALESGLQNAVRFADTGDLPAARAQLESITALARTSNYL